MNTDALIGDLVATAKPVKPLARPEVRALGWTVFALLAVTAVMAIHGIDTGQVRAVVSDPRAMGEVAATLATAISAAIAAFQSTVPGAGRRWFFVPFVDARGVGAADRRRVRGRLRGDGSSPRSGCASTPPASCRARSLAAVLTVVLLLMIRRGCSAGAAVDPGLCGDGGGGGRQLRAPGPPRGRRVDHAAGVAHGLCRRARGDRRMGRAGAVRMAAAARGCDPDRFGSTSKKEPRLAAGPCEFSEAEIGGRLVLRNRS